MSSPSNTQSGFTLIELIVSVSIFVFMTAFLVGKFGKFNQSVLVTNTAYDVALTIRNAQSYAMNVRQSTVDVSATSFQHPYGVHFETGSNNFYFFSDADNNFVRSTGETITTSTIKKGLVISSIEAQCGNATYLSKTSADVSFRRPDPDAILRTTTTPDFSNPTSCEAVKLTVHAPDGSNKIVLIRSTGQIAIED
ncbi:MAG: Pili subunit [Candidatus Taylorbacteria bacterium]|nr:Pili subunit [Candidatus Taylorbacteria bacterium]